MSNGKARMRRTMIDDIVKFKRDAKRLAGQERRNVSGIRVITSGANRFGNSNSNRTDILKSSEALLRGRISLFPKTLNVVFGVIDLTDDDTSTGNFVANNTSRVVVVGEGNAPDDVDTITTAGADGETEGQLLFLQAAPYQITLKHGTGNIETPDAVDVVLADNEMAILMYDTIGDPSPYWRVVATYGGSGGGGGTEVPDWTEAHRANGYTLFLDADDNSNINAAVDDQVRIQTGGTTRMTWENTLITISDTVDVDPSSDGGVNLGSGSKQYGQVHSRTFSMWTDTTNDTTTTEAKIFRNSTRGLTLKSPSVGGSYGKHTFTDKDGVDRIIFDYDASNKNAIFNYTTGGLKVRQNASDTDGVLIYPRGNTFSSSENLLNSMGGNLSIRKDGIEKILIETSTITMTNDLDMDGEGIGNTTSIGFSTGQDITADGGGIDYKVPSGDKHEFLVAGTSVGRFVDYGLEMKDSYWVKPENNGGERMGIAATNLNNPVTVGTYGSIIIPRHSVSSSSSITTANLDSWFGSYRGCIGYLTTLSSYTNRLYVKDPLTNTWAYFNADGYV